MASGIGTLLAQLFGRIFGKKTETSPVVPGPVTLETLSAGQLKTLTCLQGTADNDPLVSAIRQDLENKASVLELIQSYMKELEGETDNDAPPFAKLARLFERGITPQRVGRHHYGIAIGLKTSDNRGVLADYSNILGLVWSTSLGKVPPWVGKTFRPAARDEIRDLTGGTVSSDSPAYIGINHFNQVEDSPLNLLSVSFLTFWMHLKDAVPEERARYGYEKTGGQFIAAQARSVYRSINRDVIQLNYRWSRLSNPLPFRYLIDEIVEIADGVYLGQLLFATKRLLSDYDPRLADKEYGYEHFGYFLLMDNRWEEEARRVFSGIGIPQAGKPQPLPAPGKLTSFTFASPVDGNCNDRILAEIQQDMKDKETILDLLKYYSDGLKRDLKGDSPYFARLGELFNRGTAPEVMHSFYHGALISFRSEGLLKVFNVNLLNLAWGLGRLFTPWNGKSFEDIDSQRLSQLTDGHETGQVPTVWGANTYSLRTVRKRMAGQLMKAAGIWTEDATELEKRSFSYDLKSFFFIARQGVSVNEDNRGKKVFQFNYRWPKLRTIPPDNFCVDEVVEIADGLVLGQLTYATEILLKYDPSTSPKSYKYGVFGYFLLMDDDWHKRRLQIGFDLDNV